METKLTDIVVIGGGAAGVAAAIGAASQGMRVVLVEKNAFAGGNATAAEVGTVCGLYKFQKGATSEWLVKGFALQFARELQSLSQSHPLCNSSGLHYLPYQIPAFKNLCGQLLLRYGVEVLYDSSIHSVDMRGNMIHSVTILNEGTEETIALSAIIDCSGHSLVSQLADLPMIKSDHYQAAAQVFTMTGLDTTDITEQALSLILMKALRSAILNQQLSREYESLFVVPGSMSEETVSLKLGMPIAVTHTRENRKALALCSKKMIKHITAFLVNEIDIFKNARLEHVAPELGIRVGFRSIGKYLLNEADVMNSRKFDDAIANADWPIEEWELDKRVKMSFLSAGDHYQVPAGCLESDMVENLFFAGRNISATDAAIASARVMGICLQTGYAAGVLAAAKAKGLPAAEAIAGIQLEQL